MLAPNKLRCNPLFACRGVGRFRLGPDGLSPRHPRGSLFSHACRVRWRDRFYLTTEREEGKMIAMNLSISLSNLISGSGGRGSSSRPSRDLALSLRLLWHPFRVFVQAMFARLKWWMATALTAAIRRYPPVKPTGAAPIRRLQLRDRACQAVPLRGCPGPAGAAPRLHPVHGRELIPGASKPSDAPMAPYGGQPCQPHPRSRPKSLSSVSSH